ncbi:MAG: GAF domain-containing protein [Actinomycetota bacterium]|nr:GAF domain-containing protein [Actinomycetota bacterium]
MNTIEYIEKRRRELRRINYFLIYLLAMTVFGMFFFIDAFSGLFGALKYNIFLRFYFITFIAAFLFYMAQKEKQQAKLTAQLIQETQATSAKLAKELRHKEFLSEINVLLTNLGDTAVLEQLFRAALRFFEADGGVVVLRDGTKSWKKPLVSFPEDTNSKVIDQIVKLIGHTGRSFVQPDPAFPDHSPIKGVKNALGVPLRLEGRLFGIIAFWSNDRVVHDHSDLKVLEFIAREATNSRFTIELVQEKNDQFNGLLALVAKAADDRRRLKDRTVKVARQAKALAKQMGLPQETVTAVEIAAMLKDVDTVIATKIVKANGANQSALILKSFDFPKRVTEILAGLSNGNGDGKKSAATKTIPIGSRVLLAAEAYVSLATPARGRGPSPVSVLAKLKAGTGSLYDEEVLDALRELVLPFEDEVPAPA